ncbi:TnpV protein [Faecalispora sporosphaeroides]|uniref:TnpV protein n=1 Tax=Faecalispora sporosphaeroides TaxID=1549 RepID=A0A928Q4S5_9FIRM|nr:TnpV protein [Faecalispora sporosphaeroides]
MNLIERTSLNEPLGKYGIKYRKFLEETQPGQYAILSTNLDLMALCLQMEQEANEYEETVLTRLRKETPPPKTENIMELIQYNNWLLKTAEEITLNDIVYQK